MQIPHLKFIKNGKFSYCMDERSDTVFKIPLCSAEEFIQVEPLDNE